MENASKALIIAGAILIAIMLITIGITLVKSGKGVTEAGTESMEISKIATFNSNFTKYEGTKKGAEIKGLWNAVRSSNGVSENDIGIYPENKPAGLKMNSDYTIELDYGDEGYINKITVSGEGI